MDISIGCYFVFFLISILPVVAGYLLISLYKGIRYRASSQHLDHFCKNWLNLSQPNISQGGWTRSPMMVTTFRNHRLAIKLRQHVSRYSFQKIYSSFELSFSNSSKFEFSIAKQEFLRAFGREYRIQDVRIGDDVFDDTFAIKTNSQELLQQVLDQGVRLRLIENLGNDFGSSFQLQNDTIRYETIGSFENNQFNNSFFNMIHVASAIADGLTGGSTVSQDRQWKEDEDYLNWLSSKSIVLPFTEGETIGYVCDIKGRKTVVKYSFKSIQKVLTISIATTQKFWLRLSPQIGQDTPDEIRIKDRLLDQKFRIHSDHSEAAIYFLNSPEVTRQLSSIHLFDSLEIGKGNIVYIIENPRNNGFACSEFKQTLGRLIRILEIYEEQKLDLHTSTLQKDTSTCPYCREVLESNRERIVTCNLCHAPHHESCLVENKQCTTWGCLTTISNFTARF
jgi:hypothetical protein